MAGSLNFFSADMAAILPMIDNTQLTILAK
jgi:hypothetical protein